MPRPRPAAAPVTRGGRENPRATPGELTANGTRDGLLGVAVRHVSQRGQRSSARFLRLGTGRPGADADPPARCRRGPVVLGAVRAAVPYPGLERPDFRSARP